MNEVASMSWQPALILFFMTFAALGGLYVAIRELIEMRRERREMATRTKPRSK